MGEVEPQFSPKIPVAGGERLVITLLFTGLYVLIGLVKKEQNGLTYAGLFKQVCQESYEHVTAPFYTIYKTITTLHSTLNIP